MASRRGARTELMTGDRRSALPSITAETFRSSRRISLFTCCRPMSCASIPRTASSFFTVSSIVPWPPQSGEGGKTFREIVRALGQDFPSDKVHEAVKRLVDRRYVVPASPSSAGAVAAYWASLGLSPDTAEQNLRNCRVRIQSIDVQGAAELGALGGLGVRVGKRSPDLTVTLASDYLDKQLG